MSETTNDGGPAFPGRHGGIDEAWADGKPTSLKDVPQEDACAWPGMTLRDWFAGMAMQTVTFQQYAIVVGTRNVPADGD